MGRKRRGRELAFSQGDLLELKGDVILLGEDVDGPAGLREKVQVELQSHGSPRDGQPSVVQSAGRSKSERRKSKASAEVVGVSHRARAHSSAAGTPGCAVRGCSRNIYLLLLLLPLFPSLFPSRHNFPVSLSSAFLTFQ